MRVTDDDIRALLRDIGRVDDGTPDGFVRVSAAEIAEHADRSAVAVWIANNGGFVEDERAEESFLVPRRALDGA